MFDKNFNNRPLINGGQINHLTQPCFVIFHQKDPLPPGLFLAITYFLTYNANKLKINMGEGDLVIHGRTDIEDNFSEEIAPFESERDFFDVDWRKYFNDKFTTGYYLAMDFKPYYNESTGQFDLALAASEMRFRDESVLRQYMNADQTPNMEKIFEALRVSSYSLVL